MADEPGPKQNRTVVFLVVIAIVVGIFAALGSAGLFVS